MPCKELCRLNGLSNATVDKLHTKFSDIKTAQLHDIKNWSAKLTKLSVEARLHIKAVTPQTKRQLLLG
ncbi:UNVERIFIED_ORG: hypothetical protein ABIC43_001414 [Variovorax guangxiensis]